MLRPVVLPQDLIGKRAPCDLFNARGVLLVTAGSVITFSVRHPYRVTRVFCPADQAARISDINPISQLAHINKSLAEIAGQLARSEQVSPGDLISLSRIAYDMWCLDADACLGYARLCRFGRPSICHVVHVSLLVAELAAAQKFDSERTTAVIGGALTMNVAKLRLHDQMYASGGRPSPEQLSEIHSHPAESVRLLGCIGKFDQQWLNAVAGHHENIDGSGYPHALRGTEIPLPARMTRVADIFAARLSGRKTRRPLHWNLQRTAGTRNIVNHIFGPDQEHLDPSLMSQLVDALGRFPPGSLVRLSNGELAVVARRIPGELATPREVLSIRDSIGHELRAPRRRQLRYGEYRIRNYANDESQKFSSYDWRQVWGYGN